MHCASVLQGSVGLSSQYDMPKKAKGFKNMITNFRALCELAYFREGFNVSAWRSPRSLPLLS